MSRFVLATLFLYMLRHPEIQAKARAELDKVVGQDRLPRLTSKRPIPEGLSIRVLNSDVLAEGICLSLGLTLRRLCGFTL